MFNEYMIRQYIVSTYIVCILCRRYNNKTLTLKQLITRYGMLETNKFLNNYYNE